MLSPSLEKAPLPPSFLTSAQAAANNSTNNHHHNNNNNNIINNPAHAASSSRCYRPFEHLLQQPMLDGGIHHLQQQQLQQQLQQQKLSWNSIGFGVSSFGLPSPPSSDGGGSIGSGFGRLLLSADTHRASSNCSSASSTRSDCSGGGSPEPLRHSPPAHASSMPRARSGFGLSNGNTTPTAMNSISSNDARLLHPLAMHYAAAAQLQQHVSNGRHPLHPLNGATGLGGVNNFGEQGTSAATLPLLFAGNLQPARMTTTGPRLDDDGCSDDELNVDSNGDDPMNSEMALNLTGRARSCSPASIASNSGSRPPSAGHSDRHQNGCPLPASFSLLTSSTILGQSSLLSSSVFPPPPSSPTPPSASTTPDMKMNSLNGTSTSAVGPTLHSKPTCASLQRAHSAPYKPHKWLRPVNGGPTTINNNTANLSVCPSQNDSASISSPLSLGSLSPLSSLAPLSPLPTPPTPPHSLSTSTSSSGNNHNGSTICSPLLHQHQQHLMPTLSGPTPSLPAPPPPPQLELRLTRQPAKFHRARYMTEGSRGPIRDKSGKSFPAIRLIGFDEHPVPVYCYLSDDRQIAQPHLFYQASKLSSRCVTSCTELRLGGTNALQFELQPSQNMELTIDCLGIVKQRLFEIQQNAAAAGGNGSNNAAVAASAAAAAAAVGLNGGGVNSSAPLDRGAKSPCCRIVFECYLPKYNHILQTYSDTIHCKQVMRAPEVHRMSSNEAPARGGGELFVIGKNFGKDARLLLRLDGGQWQAHAWPEKELLHQTHLVCRLPSFDASLMRSRGECVAGQWRVQVELYVLCDGKRSAKQLFTYYE